MNDCAERQTITGTGNVKILEAPKLKLPSDFEQYDPKVKEDITRSGEMINGTKTFEWLIVPRYPGDKKIPALEFTYFDIGQKRYITLRTNEFNIFVEKGSAEASQTAAGLTKEDVKLLNQDIRFIKTEIGSLYEKNKELIHPGTALLLTGIPLVAFIDCSSCVKKHSRICRMLFHSGREKAMKIAAKKLLNAKHLLTQNKHEAFYAEVSTAMWRYVSDKLDIERSKLSIDNVTQQFLQKKVSEELTQRIKACLEACEFARFAPGSSSQEEKNKMYETATNVIIATEREMTR